VSYLSSAAIASIRARIAEKEAQLVLANATYTKLLAQDTQEYRFSSGEASQWATKRSLKELKDQIESLEASIDELNRRIDGAGGLVMLTLRRQ
jgi:uncharacterized protein YcbX